MSGPREIIEQTLEKSFYALTYGELAAEIETALQSHGYRIVGPGLDAETIEACAAICDEIDNSCGMEEGLAKACAAAIRALGEKP